MKTKVKQTEIEKIPKETEASIVKSGFSGKSLIGIDTNIMLTKQEWETDFSKLNPKGSFLELIDFVERNKLQDLIALVIPEIVIEEFSKTKNENFNNSLKSLKTKIPLFKQMDCCDFSNLKLPGDSYNYREYVLKKINEITKEKKFVKLIPLDMSNSKIILEDLRKRALNGKKPFKNGSDRGFKDSLIWHCFIGNIELDKFDFFYFLTENSNDFDYELEEEFEKKFSRNLKIFNDSKALISKLSEYYNLFEDYPEIVAYLKTDYFKGKLVDFLSSILNLKIDASALSYFCKGINELSFEEYEGFGLNEIYPKEDMDVLKLIKISVSLGKRKYDTVVVFDSDSKEIVLVNISPEI